jgi:uncharacterized protein (DUF1810 family)
MIRLDDPFDLFRFVAAQAASIDDVMAELADGAKRTHWMWFVFPQLRGLGRSDMARRYGIGSGAEARAYLAHPFLGPRLLAATALAAQAPGTARKVMGSPDDLKLRSSMTLFAAVATDPAPFTATLGRFWGGERCTDTLSLLRAE